MPALLQWLTPGIGVKRWLALLFAGVTLLGLGFAMLVVELYRSAPTPRLIAFLTLGGMPLILRAGLAGILGVAAIIFAFIRINRSILAPLALETPDLIGAMVEYQRAGRGPKIVAIGGGTGMPTLLRGLKAHTANLTAVVTVADDGGSSGKLRRDLGVLPPGDFRNNIAALAGDEGLMSRLFQYRFGEGGLEGHSFGNLFITAMGAVTGSFESALIESSRVLAIRGQVLPSTLTDVTLMADLREDTSSGVQRVEGESAIPEVAGAIERVFLRPDDPPAYPEAVRAILAADLIVLGPGSLFTSILPNLLVGGITQAIRASKALKVYVCNVATQRGETEGYSMADHLRVIERHVGRGLFNVVIANSNFPPLAADANFAYVQIDGQNGYDPGVRIRAVPLTDEKRPWRHDPEALAQAIINLLSETSAPHEAQSSQ